MALGHLPTYLGLLEGVVAGCRFSEVSLRGCWLLCRLCKAPLFAVASKIMFPCPHSGPRRLNPDAQAIAR